MKTKKQVNIKTELIPPTVNPSYSSKTPHNSRSTCTLRVGHIQISLQRLSDKLQQGKSFLLTDQATNVRQQVPCQLNFAKHACQAHPIANFPYPS